MKNVVVEICTLAKSTEKIERFYAFNKLSINQWIDQNYQEKQKQYITINWQREINELTASTATSLFDINKGMAAV